MQKKKIKISVIYVNYKSYKELTESIASIHKYNPKSIFEIIIVDNEGDPLLKKYAEEKKFKYIESKGNIGYASGNNLGTKYAKDKYILIINPDVILTSNAIDILVDFLDKNTDSAIITPKLIEEDGRVLDQLAPFRLTPLRYIFTYTFMAKLFPQYLIKRNFLKETTNSKKPYEVEVVAGSFLMIRKNIFEKLGGFDNKFFLYFEENDLCKRVKDKGYKIFISPNVKVIHDWKPSEGNAISKNIFEKSRFYYFKKHYGIIKALLVEVFSRRWWLL